MPLWDPETWLLDSTQTSQAANLAEVFRNAYALQEGLVTGVRGGGGLVGVRCVRWVRWRGRGGEAWFRLVQGTLLIEHKDGSVSCLLPTGTTLNQEKRTETDISRVESESDV